jgi:soluble lytic murein transglycosylase-like protein
MIGAVILILVGLAWVLLATAPVPSGWPRQRVRGWLGWAAIVVGLIIISLNAPAATPGPVAAPGASRVKVRVPEVSAMYRRWVEQAVAEEWGVEGSPARLAAQIHQESSWNAKARSAVGAEGLAQFMPATARWIAQAYPDQLGKFDPWDPQQAALAAAVYDAHLVRRNPGATTCDSWAFGFSAYNGGETRLRREQALARQHGTDPNVWFGSVANQRARGAAAWRENRGYVRRILLQLEPAYVDAGWAGQVACV